jgi:hypothetical protein
MPEVTKDLKMDILILMYQSLIPAKIILKSCILIASRKLDYILLPLSFLFILRYSLYHFEMYVII